MSAKNVMFSAMTLLATGVVIGILVAPAKGSETRQKLSDAADSLKKKLQRLRGTTSEELEEMKEIFEHEVQGLKDDVRQRVLTLIRAAKSNGNSIKEEAMS
jgi:gas vesicle protein